MLRQGNTPSSGRTVHWPVDPGAKTKEQNRGWEDKFAFPYACIVKLKLGGKCKFLDHAILLCYFVLWQFDCDKKAQVEVDTIWHASSDLLILLTTSLKKSLPQAQKITSLWLFFSLLWFPDVYIRNVLSDQITNSKNNLSDNINILYFSAKSQCNRSLFHQNHQNHCNYAIVHKLLIKSLDKLAFDA